MIENLGPAARPTRGTYRGHGTPARACWFGTAREISGSGRVVDFIAAGARVEAVDAATGEVLAELGGSSLIWLAAAAQITPGQIADAGPAVTRLEQGVEDHMRWATNGRSGATVALVYNTLRVRMFAAAQAGHGALALAITARVAELEPDYRAYEAAPTTPVTEHGGGLADGDPMYSPPTPARRTYRQTGLIEDMTDAELVREYAAESSSPGRQRVTDITTGAAPGNRRKANHELERLDRRLAIMRRVAGERGVELDPAAAAERAETERAEARERAEREREQRNARIIAERAAEAPADEIIIVPCGGKKLDRPAPAGEMYVGSYHAATRRAAAARGGLLLILSAKYGLIDPETVIEPYDLRMGQPGSVTPGQVAGQAFALGVLGASRVTVLAGRSYADVIRRVWPAAERPLEGTRGIGEQHARLALMAGTARQLRPVATGRRPTPAAAPEISGQVDLVDVLAEVVDGRDLATGDVAVPGSFGMKSRRPITIRSGAVPLDAGRVEIAYQVGDGPTCVGALCKDSRITLARRGPAATSDAPEGEPAEVGQLALFAA